MIGGCSKNDFDDVVAVPRSEIDVSGGLGSSLDTTVGAVFDLFLLFRNNFRCCCVFWKKLYITDISFCAYGKSATHGRYCQRRRRCLAGLWRR